MTEVASSAVGSSTLTMITTSVAKAAQPRRPRHTRVERSCSDENTIAMNTAHDTAPLSGHSTTANSTVTIITSQSRALFCKAGEFRGSGGLIGARYSRGGIGRGRPASSMATYVTEASVTFTYCPCDWKRSAKTSTFTVTEVRPIRVTSE